MEHRLRKSNEKIKSIKVLKKEERPLLLIRFSIFLEAGRTRRANTTAKANGAKKDFEEDKPLKRK
jgi:hypothetical protein